MYPELKKVLQHIVSKIDLHKLGPNYSLLSQAYENILKASTPENDAEIVRLENLLKAAQLDIEPNNFSNKEKRIFTSYDTEQVLGARALTNIAQQLSTLSNNPHGVSTVYASVANEITALHKRATQILSDLGDIWGEEKPEDTTKTQIDIAFEGGVAINNLRSLHEQSGDWVKIVCFAQKMLKKPTEDPVIVSVSKASPFDASLLGDPVLLSLIFYNFHQVLDTVKKILEIVQEIQKINLLVIDTKLKKTALDALEESKEKALAEQLEEIIKIEFQKLREHLKTDEEAKSSGRFLVQHIYNFANNEGTVTISNPTVFRETTGMTEEAKPFDDVKEIADLRQALNNPKLPNALIDPKAEAKLIKTKKVKPKEQAEKPKRKYTKKIKTSATAVKQPVETVDSSTSEGVSTDQKETKSS